MTWTAITTQNPGDGWTTTKVNQWVKGNIEHLAGMTVGGTALSALAGGSELLLGNLIDDDDLGGVATYTISSIPQTYKNLKLIVVAKSGAGSEDSLIVRVGNGSVDTAATLYSRNAFLLTNTTVSGFADEAGSASLVVGCSINSTAGAANRYSTTIIQIPLYAGGIYKTTHWSHRANIAASAAGQKTAFGGGTWNSASAIDTIGILTVSGSNFATDSHYYLFGEY